MASVGWYPNVLWNQSPTPHGVSPTPFKLNTHQKAVHTHMCSQCCSKIPQEAGRSHSQAASSAVNLIQNKTTLHSVIPLRLLINKSFPPLESHLQTKDLNRHYSYLAQSSVRRVLYCASHHMLLNYFLYLLKCSLTKKK